MKPTSSRFPFAVSILLLAVAADPRAAVGTESEPCADWEISGFGIPGTDSEVLACALFDAGSGPEIHVGGGFVVAGRSRANGVARWDGNEWHSLGDGVSGELRTVRTLLPLDDGRLIAGGSFTSAGGVEAHGIASWDGHSWSAIGPRYFRSVSHIVSFDDGSGPALYASGPQFEEDGGNRPVVARWTGTEWVNLKRVGLEEPQAIVVFDDGSGPALYAARSGTVVRWNGDRWVLVGGYWNDDIASLVVHDDGTGPALYAGGEFERVGDVPVNRVARWDGIAWADAGAGLAGDVRALFALDLGEGPALVAIEEATTPTGQFTTRAVSFDGAAWTAIPNLTGAGIGTALSFPTGAGGPPSLVVGGQFTSFEGTGASNVALFDGSAWRRLGSGLSNAILSVVRFDDGSGPALAVMGSSHAFDSSGAKGIARLDAGGLSPIGVGFVGTGSALIVYDSGHGPELIASGTLESVGSGVARWDGSTWSHLGPPLNGVAYGLFSLDDGGGPALFATGNFTTPNARLVRFDGAAWTPFPHPSPTFGLHSMAVFDDGSGPSLYAGTGDRFVLRWTGAAWEPTEGRSEGAAHELLVFDDGSGPALFASGGFKFVGSRYSVNFARFDGVDWTPLDATLGDALSFVSGLHVLDDGTGPTLYATGAGGGSVGRVARLSGGRWCAVGSDFDSGVADLEVLETGRGATLYAVGDFLFSGDAVSPYVALRTDTCAAALRGNVNAGAGAIEDVLFVNDSSGAPTRRLSLDRRAPLTVFVSVPSAEPGRAPYALYAYAGTPGPADVTRVPGLGLASFPTPLSGGTPRLRTIWNNTGIAALGAASFPSEPAPWLVLERPTGTGARVRFTLQGIIADPGSGARRPWSVTNAVVVETR